MRIHGPFATHILLLSGLLVSAATPAVAQTMSFSFYKNLTVGSTGRVYADITAYDNSSGCSHSAYSTTATFYGPNSTSSFGYGSMSASTSLLSGDGDYTVVPSLQLTCSCMNYSRITVGGPSQTGNRAQFRAVFSYRGLNGPKYEYGGMCTHSCQPSRICMSGSNNYAYFNGFKLVTPVATRCQPSGVYSLSSTYNANPCVGTGTGLWTSFDDNCPD